MSDATNNKRESRPRKFESGLLVLALVFLVVLHEAAFRDRFLLILYYLGAAGAAYALVLRRALGFAAITIAMACAATFAAAYYQTKSEAWIPWLDQVRDLCGLALLLCLAAGVVRELYRFQEEEKGREFRRAAERKMVEMRANALRSTSHEVRTPLTTITALSEMLSDGSAGELNDVQREFVQDIDVAAQHVLALVNDILDYAKAEAGMIQLAPEAVALVELVEQCLTMVRPKAEAGGVQVSYQVAPEVREIVADPLRLKQILLNLLSNAVKYNYPGGTVALRVRPDGGRVLISVRDTGRGIAPEHMPHLFDPYYQAAVADQGIGTGLGLAIIKHLTELHGGTVQVESVFGEGSRFMVRLPLEQPAGMSTRGSATLHLPAHDLPQDGAADAVPAASI